MEALAGKVAIVTGASRGISRGIALGLAAEGAAVTLTARTAAQLAVTAHLITDAGGEALIFPADIGLEQAVADLFQATLTRWARVDILVNNAGAFDGGPLDELTVDAWDRVMTTNLRGPFLCTREAFRTMKPQGGGRIINIGSISGQRARPNMAPYTTSKHGIWGLTQATALEGRDFGITCCCLHPGNVRVERRASGGNAVDREPMMEVKDVARIAVLMATLPANVEMLEAIVLPMEQRYAGRG
ncbi:MAG: SDR family oxidoreductase [Chloroflexi bacterium]|nr:SDR family oxidoreductase [Chloroflexota bacterium]